LFEQPDLKPITFAYFGHFLSAPSIVSNEDERMALGFDELVERLLHDVALSGPRGKSHTQRRVRRSPVFEPELHPLINQELFY